MSDRPTHLSDLMRNATRKVLRTAMSAVRPALLALPLSILAASPAGAAKKDNSIRFAVDQTPENIDPYFNNVRIGVIIGQQVWDTLIYRDPNTNEYKGQLATSLDGSTTRRSSSSCAEGSSSTTARNSTPTTSSTR